MSTKIMGHRIGEKQIKNNHMADDFRVSEGDKVLLNFPSHSNANDLTALQRQILTQGGLADSLHYHSGGGGGEEGIYTHPQIDAAILSLTMEMNSQKYGLDNAIVDRFDDSLGVFRGISRPVIDSVTEITSTTDVNTLTASRTYYYKAAIKWRDCLTDASAPIRFTTSDVGIAPYRKAQVQMELPSDNKGLKIWRAVTDLINQDIFLELYKSIYSPESMRFEIVPGAVSGHPNGKSALVINYNGVVNDVMRDLVSSVNGGVMIGTTIGSVQNMINGDTVVKYGVRFPSNTYSISQINLNWNSNPAYVPQDYKIEYATIPNPNIDIDTDWMPIRDLQLVIDDGMIQNGTNGTIDGEYIINNTVVANKFCFGTIPNPSGIRVTILRVLSGVRLDAFVAYYMGYSNGFKVVHSLDQSRVDLTGMKTMIIDIKADINHDRFTVGIVDAAYVAAITNQTTIYSSNNNNTSFGASLTTTYRSRSYMDSANQNRVGFNKVRVRISVAANTRISNITIGFDNSATSAISLPQTIRYVTFNGGLTTPTFVSAGLYWSDWIGLEFPNATFTYAIMSCICEQGTVYEYGANGNMYTYSSTVANASWDTSGAIWSNYQGSYSMIQGVEIAKGYETRSLKALPKNFNTWYTHYIDISGSANGVTNLKNMIFKMNGIDQSGNVYFSNIRFSAMQELIKVPANLQSITAKSTNGSFPINNINDSVLSSYWESNAIPTTINPEILMFKFKVEQKIERLRMLVPNSFSYAPERYSFQYTIDTTAIVTDPTDSAKWMNMEALQILNATQVGFTGLVDGNSVTAGNAFGDHVDHKWASVNALAMRIIFWKTTANTAVRVNDIEIYTKEDPAEYVLIGDFNTKQAENFVWIDPAIAGTPDSPPFINTTGSQNIWYDTGYDMIRVYDKAKPAILQTNTVETELFLRALINVQSIDVNGMLYWISADGGLTWTETIPGEVTEVPTPGNEFRLMVSMTGNDALSAYSVLYSL